MYKIIIIISVVIILPLHVSCFFDPDIRSYRINLKNNTNDTIYAICSMFVDDRYVKQEKLENDSSVYFRNKCLPMCDTFVTIIITDRGENCLSTKDTITLFLVDKEVFEQNNWCQMVELNKIRQVYHLSGDDIRMLKSMVPYPPTELMRNMCIYPAYNDN